MKFKELTKEDLNSLRIMAHYPIKSNLKKADLVSALEDAFRKDPVSLLQALPVYDLLIMQSLCDLDRDQCAVYELPTALPSSMYYGLVEWEYNEDEAWKINICLSDEMYMLISPFIKQVVDERRSSKKYLLEYFFWGMLYIYGTPTMGDYLEVLKATFGEKEDAWWQMFLGLCKYYPFGADKSLQYNGHFVNPDIEDPEAVFEQQRARGMDVKPLKKYSMDEILSVGETGPFFVYDKHSDICKKAISALEKCGYGHRDAVARLSRIWVDVQDDATPKNTTQILQKAIGEPKLRSVEELNSIIQALTDYMNNLPRWCLGGRTPKDIPVPPNALAGMSAMLSGLKKANSMPDIRNVRRNDPCPCGSGLKFKNCHGKNIS